jgi:hypothetical protein
MIPPGDCVRPALLLGQVKDGFGIRLRFLFVNKSHCYKT